MPTFSSTARIAAESVHQPRKRKPKLRVIQGGVLWTNRRVRLKWQEVTFAVKEHHYRVAIANSGRCPVWAALREYTGMPWLIYSAPRGETYTNCGLEMWAGELEGKEFPLGQYSIRARTRARGWSWEFELTPHLQELVWQFHFPRGDGIPPEFWCIPPYESMTTLLPVRMREV